MKRAGQVDGIALSTEMQVHHVRCLKQQMVVQGRLLNPSLLQRREHGIDFVFGQDQIPHRHGSVPHGQEGGIATQSKSRFEMNALHGHGQIRSWEAIAVDATRHSNTTFSYGLIHGPPIYLCCLRRGDVRGWVVCLYPCSTSTDEQEQAADGKRQPG